MKQICDWEKIQEDSQCLTKYDKCRFDKRKKNKRQWKIIQATILRCSTDFRA